MQKGRDGVVNMVLTRAGGLELDCGGGTDSIGGMQ